MPFTGEEFGYPKHCSYIHDVNELKHTVMKEGNQINVTWKDDNMLLFKGIIGQIEFEDDNFLKFTYITKRGGISSMLVDKRFHNVEIVS